MANSKNSSHSQPARTVGVSSLWKRERVKQRKPRSLIPLGHLCPLPILFRCKFSPFLKDQAFVIYFDPQSLNARACTQTEQGIFLPLSFVKPSCTEVKGSLSKNKTEQSKTSLRPIVPTATVCPQSPLLFLPPSLKRITGKVLTLQLN